MYPQEPQPQIGNALMRLYYDQKDVAKVVLQIERLSDQDYSDRKMGNREASLRNNILKAGMETVRFSDQQERPYDRGSSKLKIDDRRVEFDHYKVRTYSARLAFFMYFFGDEGTPLTDILEECESYGIPIHEGLPQKHYAPFESVSQ